MKHQYRFDLIIVVTYEYIEDNDIISLIKKAGNLYFYTLKKGYSINEVISEGYALQYLDYFIIILPTRYEEQRIFWKEFYNAIGHVYENLIDESNNVLCINEMIIQINRHILIDEKTIVLDYGCGIGISKEVGCKGRIVGYDSNNFMRHFARKRGLEVVGEKEFINLPEKYFDACFASYVFHMAVSEEDINILIKKLKDKAVVVANFYKDINIDRVNSYFEKKNFKIAKINNVPERYGSFYEYTKM